MSYIALKPKLMNPDTNAPLHEKLRRFDRETGRRQQLVTVSYSAAMVVAIGLSFLPFPLSRVGSALLVVAFAYMIWKPRNSSTGRTGISAAPVPDFIMQGLAKVKAQIALGQSACYNLPFLVGANLFFMGLPGTGTREEKTMQDCFFLAATVLLFTIFGFVNQRIVRTSLCPLKCELESLALQGQRATSASGQSPVDS